MAHSSPPKRTLKRLQVIVDTEKNCNWAGPNLRGGSARWLLALATLVLSAGAQAQAPTANLDTFPNVPEDAVNFLMDVAANDTGVDIDLTSVDVNPGDEPNNGVATANGDGTFNYTPIADYFGPDSFNYIICNTVPECSIGSVNITVNSINDPPTALDDGPVIVAEGGSNPGTLNVLTNDSDLVEGDSLTAVLVAGPANEASFTLNADGTFSYTHDGSETTSDSFTYQADDGDPSNTATVSITITPVNDAPTAVDDGPFFADEGGSVPGNPSVLSNDTDPEDDTLTAVLIVGPANAASFSLNQNGRFSYTHDGTNTLSDSFTYQADDGDRSNTATVSITINAVNDPPTAVDDGPVIVAEGGTISGSFNVLTNDTDPEGNPLTAVLNSGPANAASFTLNSNGTFNYVHNGSETTSDSFTYRASDGSPSNTATVSITITPVNDAPTAVNDGPFVANEGGSVPGNPSVLSNDTDPEGDSLTAVLIAGPANASSFTLNANGRFSYTHDGSDTTSDSFTYQADDGDRSNTATVSISINAVNDPPTAVDDGPVAVDEGGTIPGSFNVLANDSDPENDPLTALLVSGPGNASSFALNANGTFTYVHNGSETISDSFTYRASDGGPSNIATVSINVNPVNDSPVATPISNQSATEGAPFSLDVLGNFSDPDGDSLTFTATGLPASLDPIDAVDGIIFGNPTQAEAEANGGVYNVTVTATDPSNATASSSFTLTIGAVNDTPVIVTPIGDRSADEGALFTLDVSANFNDPDGDSLTFTATGLPVSLDPIGATDGIIDGIPTQAEAEFNGGVYNVTVTVTDPTGEFVSDSFVLTIGTVNDPPVAIPQTVSTNEDEFINLVLAGSDPENDVLTFAILTQPVNGTAGSVGADATYTPNLDFSGTDSFTFTANDGEFTSLPATVTITVVAVNDPPMVLLPIEDQLGVEGTAFSLAVTANFTDPDGDPLTYIASGLPPSGNLSFNGQTGVLSGTPRQEDARDNDPYLIIVTAIDGGPDGDAVDDFALNISALDRANVSLDVIVSPNPAMQNDQLRWTYTVRNTVGPQVAPNVVLNGSFFGTGLTVTTANACTILAPVGQVTNFSCVVGQLPLGASTAVVLNTATSAVGDVATFATAEGADPLPIDPNLDDNSKQTAVGVAASFSNGAVNVLGVSNIRAVAFGDVDGDGVGDLVVGTSAGQPIQIWLGDGFRGFAAAPLTVADTAANECVALADFNGNGRLDLVVANGGGQADLVYRNDGGGNFTLMRTLGSTFSQDVAAGDFDNDGAMDIAIATTQGNSVYLGNGAGDFTLHATLGNANSQAVAVGQFNADARDDLVFANIGGASNVWIKNTGAGFTSSGLLLIGDATAVTVGEFGGDATQDVAFGRTSSGIGDVPANPVLVNNGTGQFAVPMATLGSATTAGIHAGDVNADGLTDLVFINSSGVHQIWVNTGGGFRLHAEQIFSDGAAAGVLAEIGMTDIGNPGGVDLAMGGTLQFGLGVFLNDGFGNLGMGDAVPPVLTLTGDGTLVIPSGSVYTDMGATAEDNIDGTISARVVVGNPVNTSTLGTYTVTYDVSDLAGNAAMQITRTVNVAPDTGGGGGGGGSVNPFVVFLLMLMALFAAHQSNRAIIWVGERKQK